MGAGPVAKVFLGVILLAVVFIVGTNGTVGCHLPLLVGHQFLHAAIGIFHPNVQTAFRQTEDRGLVGFVLTHGEVTAIAHHYPDSRQRIEQRGHVVGVVIDGLPIVGRYGFEHLVGRHFLTIHKETIET